MSDQLRRLLADLADEAPRQVDPLAVRHAALRRQAVALGAAAALIGVTGLGAAALLRGPGTDKLETAPVAAGPVDALASESPTADPGPTAAPSPATAPSGEATVTPSDATSPQSSAAPSADPAPPPPARDRFPGLPDQIIAADGSRVATYRSSDGARTSWLSPEDPGYGISSLAMSDKFVLYGAGNAQKDTRNVRLVVHPARDGAGVGHVGEPGTFMPTVLDDGSRYAFLATGDDGAYSPRTQHDLRLVMHEMDAGIQAARLDPQWLLGGLTFASRDRLVLSVARTGDRGRHGLQVFDFQTDEAPLGSRAPDTRFLPAPGGCAWTLPTATLRADQILVLERCEASGGGDSNAVTVDVLTGQRLGLFGTVRAAGPGQVDSLDLDATGKHLIAQVHSGEDPEPGGPAGTASGEKTIAVGGGKTVTTSERLTTPVWR
jgi:hypothetical protein